MTLPGKNGPCPCGSGKKYKQCCYGPDKKGENSRKRARTLAMIALTASAIGGVAAYGVYQAFSPGPHESLAKCLAGKGYRMYGAFWCEKCKEQKSLFGKSFQFIPYVECDADGDRELSKECSDKRIKRFPTWTAPGTDAWRGEGFHTAEELAESSSCPVGDGSRSVL